MTDYQIVEAMLTYGGSFVQAIGRAWMAADPRNQARLRAAFPDYFADYEPMARHDEHDARRPEPRVAIRVVLPPDEDEP